MDAFFARNRLSAYLDGSLSEAEAAEVEESLARDPTLRADYEAMQRAVAMLREAGPARAPQGFHARVMDQIAAQPVKRSALAWLYRPLARVPVEAMALAAAALIVVIAIQLRPDAPPAPPAADPEVAVSTPAPLPTTPPTPAPPAPETSPSVQVAETLQLGKKESALPKPAKMSTPTPAEPYQTDWEKAAPIPGPPEALPTEGDENLSDRSAQVLTNGVGMRSELSYRVINSPADALQRLLALAEQTGGQLIDAQGRPVVARELTVEDNFAQVQLVIPSGEMKTASATLGQLGARPVLPPSGAALHPADRVTIHVELQYKP